jgi:2-polyprenyl-3-methyl-5-hydroxy-6-metoxy-1,4-benzoquinol methylase
MTKHKKIWEHYGEYDPYFVVSTHDKYKADNIDDEKLAEFFLSGDEYVENIWEEIENGLIKNFHPQKALDFGCGVGRLTIPLGGKCKKVLGVDVSSKMIEEARSNADRRGISNVEFSVSEEDFSNIPGEFDLVHSFIVLQHINPKIGIKVFENLVNKVKQGGIGVLQLTYSNPFPKINQLTRKAYTKIPLIYKLRNLVKGVKEEPILPMYNYNLNKIFRILQDNHCHRSIVRFTVHGFDGILIIFKKEEDIFN